MIAMDNIFFSDRKPAPQKFQATNLANEIMVGIVRITKQCVYIIDEGFSVPT
jgi:hypothetical protein